MWSSVFHRTQNIIYNIHTYYEPHQSINAMVRKGSELSSRGHLLVGEHSLYTLHKWDGVWAASWGLAGESGSVQLLFASGCCCCCRRWTTAEQLIWALPPGGLVWGCCCPNRQRKWDERNLGRERVPGCLCGVTGMCWGRGDHLRILNQGEGQVQVLLRRKSRGLVRVKHVWQWHNIETEECSPTGNPDCAGVLLEGSLQVKALLYVQALNTTEL